MGLQPIDVFNDILTNENDLKNFLEQSDVKTISTSSPGIIIQGTCIQIVLTYDESSFSAYLAFVKKINGNVFEPIQQTISNTQNPTASSVFDDAGQNASSSRPSSGMRIEEIPNFGGTVDTAGFYEEENYLDEDNHSDDDDDWDAPKHVPLKRRKRTGNATGSQSLVPFPPVNDKTVEKEKRKYQRKNKFNKKRTDQEKEAAPKARVYHFQAFQAL